MTKAMKRAIFGLGLTKGDVILAIVFLLMAGAMLFWTSLYFGGNASNVEIFSHGEKVGTFEINIDREIEVQDGKNVVAIENGKVFMKSADCKNQHCVMHAPISKGNEQIVCLPNSVLVEITSDGGSDIDAVAN